MNFKLKTPNSKNESLILFYANLKNGERFVYSTGERIHPQYWDKSNQYPKKSKVKDEQITYNLISGQLDRYTKLFRSFRAQCAATEDIVTKKALKDCFNQEFKRVKRNNDFETVFDEYVEYVSGNFKPKANTSNKAWSYEGPKLRETQHVPSRVTKDSFAPALQRQPLQYSGERRLVGIATMHKSNMVPVFADDDDKNGSKQATEIAQMRRN